MADTKDTTKRQLTEEKDSNDAAKRLRVENADNDTGTSPAAALGFRRRRVEEEEEEESHFALLADDDYTPYVPVKLRKAEEEEKRKERVKALHKKLKQLDGGDDEDSDSDEEGGRKAGDGAQREAAPVEAIEMNNAEEEEDSKWAPAERNVSLFEQVKIAQEKRGGVLKTEEEARREEEEDLLRQVTQAQVPALVSLAEHAQGIKYAEPLKTSWRPPRHIREMSEEKVTKIRKKYHIIVQGQDVPPPVRRFKDMRFPGPILQALKDKGIKSPTPIQVQGLPVILSGRDIIGIAFTGSGKTMVFVLPLIMMALEEETKMPLANGEGPIGIIMCPSRELARQTYEQIEYISEYLVKGGYPELRSMLAIGGEDIRTQLAPVRKGFHMVVATPGRLNDHLNKKRFNLDLCKYICLDEGDRMLDLGFDEEIKNVFSFFTHQRQTLIFSATMPKKFQDFAQQSLVKPVLVNVGRAGAASLDVVQEVEYVKEEARILYLLRCLQKTGPPVLIFCENKSDVDDIHEYLLVKGVAAVSIHGGKPQEERNMAIKQFRAGEKDVLIATDVAAKGLDFPNIQHVINFDMPKEIENYVHRIGRTGRGGSTGLATTFINKSVEESTLLDLKHLLVEAKQRVPPVLMALEDPADLVDDGSGKGCAYCGGLGHRIANCPKLAKERAAISGNKRDFLAGGDY